MGRLAVLAAALAAAATAVAGQGLCLLAHCARPLLQCQRDPTCRSWMRCTRACSNLECQMRCGDLHASPLIDAFSQCLIADGHCVPQRRDVCARPAAAALAPRFRLEMLTGHWFVAAGWNPLFDCFDCQSHTFTLDAAATPPRLHGTLRYWVRRNLDCQGRRCRHLRRTLNQSWVQDPAVPGHLQNHNNSYLHYADDWYVLSASDRHVLVYYCGCNDAWCGYQGSVLYTRQPAVPPVVARAVVQAIGMANLPNYSYDAMCRPDNALRGCG